MQDRRVDAVAVGLLTVVAAAGLLLWPSLPERMAIHWGVGGAPDSYVSRPLATVGLPAFGTATVAFVRLSQRWTRTSRAEANVSVLALGVVVAWTGVLVLAWNLGYRFDPLVAVLPVVALALAAAVAVRSGRVGWPGG